MKQLKSILTIAMILNITSAIGQKIKCEYHIDSTIREKPQLVYGLYDGAYRDTLIDCNVIEVFEMVNPSYYKKEFRKVAAMKHLRVLRLIGNDTDDFEEYKMKYFRQLTKSKYLEKICTYSINNLENFRKYLLKKGRIGLLVLCS